MSFGLSKPFNMPNTNVIPRLINPDSQFAGAPKLVIQYDIWITYSDVCLPMLNRLTGVDWSWVHTIYWISDPDFFLWHFCGCWLLASLMASRRVRSWSAFGFKLRFQWQFSELFPNKIWTSSLLKLLQIPCFCCGSIDFRISGSQTLGFSGINRHQLSQPPLTKCDSHSNKAFLGIWVRLNRVASQKSTKGHNSSSIVSSYYYPWKWQ